ncbi:hypothetical protein DDD63_02970 [Actinobaculum sp. 313]|nr:hypothetical protein DDD63_02970 [Actinobaculum sp. 313]
MDPLPLIDDMLTYSTDMEDVVRAPQPASTSFPRRLLRRKQHSIGASKSLKIPSACETHDSGNL